MRFYLLTDCLDFYQGMRISVPRFLYITPNAPDITPTQPDEVSRMTLVKPFALNRIKIFHERKKFMGNMVARLIHKFDFFPRRKSSKVCCQGFLSSAARNVLSSNEAIVIGPTPPGTGVINEVLGATFLKSTSPFIAHPF